MAYFKLLSRCFLMGLSNATGNLSYDTWSLSRPPEYEAGALRM
jgi:hypothetical protein